MTPTLMVYYIERDVYDLSKDIFYSWYIMCVQFCNDICMSILHEVTKQSKGKQHPCFSNNKRAVLGGIRTHSEV